MQLEEESRIWQTIGIIAWAAGAGMLAILFKLNGVIEVADLATLSNGLAASFMILAGIAATVVGRVMHAELHGYKADEARLWHTFAMICCSCGAFAVLYVTVGHWKQSISLTALTVGLAGSFLIMAGIICLLGNRIMHHASRQHAATSTSETAKAGA